MQEYVTMMEPMLPPSGQRDMDDLALTLVEKSSRMAANIPPVVQQHIAALVRSMNCYYSNLIEDHNTHPRDIERALAADFATDTQKRDLQREAKAHIEVQALIDAGSMPFAPFTRDAVCWVHAEFYNRLPEDLCWAENAKTGERIRVKPGQLRTSEVVVGQHIPPLHTNIDLFLKRFEEAYTFANLSRVEQIVAVAAAHHRLLWIHPFYDGNGRVTRLLSHAAFREAGIGNGLWSISRGLARAAQTYKTRLDGADHPRTGDLDGRGSLSQKGLIAFCQFFLEAAIDQTHYMGQILDITNLLARMETFINGKILRKELPKGSWEVMREALLKGEIPRNRVPEIANYGPRQARNIVFKLTEEGLIGSQTPYGPVSLRFPHAVVEAYFPNLYPPALAGEV